MKKNLFLLYEKKEGKLKSSLKVERFNHLPFQLSILVIFEPFDPLIKQSHHIFPSITLLRRGYWLYHTDRKYHDFVTGPIFSRFGAEAMYCVFTREDHLSTRVFYSRLHPICRPPLMIETPFGLGLNIFFCEYLGWTGSRTLTPQPPSGTLSDDYRWSQYPSGSAGVFVPLIRQDAKIKIHSGTPSPRARKFWSFRNKGSV